MESPLSGTVIKDNIKASRHCDDELLEFAVSMRTAGGPAGNVIEVVHTSNLERDVATAFHEGQISAPVVNDRQIHDSAIA